MILHSPPDETKTSPSHDQHPWWDRRLGKWLPLSYEGAAWTGVVLLSLFLRCYHLGSRVMGYDEALHAYYSFEFSTTGLYQHHPGTHGPLLFHLTALLFWIFGDSETAARLGPALAGTAMVLMVWCFRRYMGRTGALAAALIMSVSPSLLFYSRYLRNDIYLALLVLAWIYCTFRYLDTGVNRWLYGLVTAMALACVTKENAFIFGAVFGTFLLGVALAQRSAGQQRLLSNPHAHLAVLMLTLVLPFLAPLGHRLLGWDPLDHQSRQGLWHSALMVGLFTLASVALAAVWFGRGRAKNAGFNPGLGLWGQLMAWFWLIQVSFFSTFFTNLPRGLATGIAGSVGYWLVQQGVARGGQPWFYYLFLSLLYEFLPLVLSLGGMLYLNRWVGRPGWDPVPQRDLPAGVAVDSAPGASSTLAEAPDADHGYPALLADHADDLATRLRRNRVHFAFFGLWWTGASWIAYMAAGEKMPWLLVHLALPMAMFGGWWLGSYLNRMDWSSLDLKRGLWVVGTAPALAFMLWILLEAGLDPDHHGWPLGGPARTLLSLAGAALVFFRGMGHLIRAGKSRGAAMVILGSLVLLLALTVRFSLMLTYVNQDLATEFLVYAHGTPDIKRAAEQIARVKARMIGNASLLVAYDGSSTWPLRWYLRRYTRVVCYGQRPSPKHLKAAVIIVEAEQQEKVEASLGENYLGRRYRQLWWPLQGYARLGWRRLARALNDPQQRYRWWQILFYRRYPGTSLDKWPLRRDFQMYIRKDVVDLAPGGGKK